MLEIKKVRDKKGRKKFIRLPWKIYKGDENWVPPLLIDEKETFNKQKYPFFEHSEADFFLAYKDTEPVGRIAAIKNNNHLETYNDNLGFFGFFESINDQEVANKLFNRAEQWLSKRGLNKIRGPENYTQNEEVGVLVDNFSRPPAIMMPYNHEYYLDLYENYGFTKEKDLLAYVREDAREIPERLEKKVNLIERRYDFNIRPIDMDNLDEEVDRIVEVYNQAWSQNWGAVKMTRSEIDHLKEELKYIVVPDLVLIAEVDDKPVGISVTLPDINQVLINMNGRLFPTGIFKLLWHKLRNWKSVTFTRTLLLGVLEEYRHMGIDLAFYYYTFKNGLANNFTSGEMSWILKDNKPMRNALEKIYGLEPYKTYRLYQKDITE